jgi:nitrite reductase (NADH) large subunit
LDWCKDQIADLDTRRALYDRFMLSQSVYQTDPWAELAERPADWAPIADLTLRAAE